VIVYIDIPFGTFYCVQKIQIKQTNTITE